MVLEALILNWLQAKPNERDAVASNYQMQLKEMGSVKKNKS